MMGSPYKELLAKRRDRAIATILGYKDDYCNDYLPDGVSDGLRKEILDQINDFYDFALDALSTQSVHDEPGVILNEEYLARLEKQLDRVVSLRTRYRDIPFGDPRG